MTMTTTTTTAKDCTVPETQGRSNSGLGGPRGPRADYAVELENRMLIRQEKIHEEKLGRRDSRLGLRKMFARSKVGKDDDALNHAHLPAKPAGFPSSKAVADQLRQCLHGENRSQSSLPANFACKPLPVAVGHVQDEQLQQHHHRAPSAKPKKARAEQAWKEPKMDWSLPPLFKAFPQAVCHATLPATCLSADAILRINGKKNHLQTMEQVGIMPTTLEGGGETLGGDKAKFKTRVRRNGTALGEDLEWTTKTYILATSGYLLQYSGQGAFDRLPEKILRLGPSSAAFASDAIPGRHWVIHLSSSAIVDDVQTFDARSILSRLSFRLAERRTTANLFLVFRDAESMEGWLASLRAEIEKQGGKGKSPEPGRPEHGGIKGSARQHAAQRTLIWKDRLHGSNAAAGGTSIQRELREDDGL
ncbi:hypothetical protein UVI_02036900 [Ustilaginoidea virens]|uniref:PH domain-containing protein n=1 Tax=Ustilaginoidea virens TaxID=1159556 RepID=A0A1B5L6Q1_USTVR|nr:hypothetical protein UVI_02036900 [Ustilaginoidea virens]